MAIDITAPAPEERARVSGSKQNATQEDDAAPVVGRPLTPPPKVRRRPTLVAAAVAAICLGALLAGWAYTSMSEAEQVIAVRQDVQRGQVIGTADLMAVQISADPALRPVAAARIEELVGMRAAKDLSAGGLLTEEAVTTAVVPVSGMSLVGVSLPPSLMPGEALYAGDTVRIVSTPGQQGAATVDGEEEVEPVVIEATVVAVRTAVDASGLTVVDVSVPHDQAADLAARVATGNVALVLDSREE